MIHYLCWCTSLFVGWFMYWHWFYNIESKLFFSCRGSRRCREGNLQLGNWRDQLSGCVICPCIREQDRDSALTMFPLRRSDGQRGSPSGTLFRLRLLSFPFPPSSAARPRQLVLPAHRHPRAILLLQEHRVHNAAVLSSFLQSLLDTGMYGAVWFKTFVFFPQGNFINCNLVSSVPGTKLPSLLSPHQANFIILISVYLFHPQRLYIVYFTI